MTTRKIPTAISLSGLVMFSVLIARPICASAVFYGEFNPGSQYLLDIVQVGPGLPQGSSILPTVGALARLDAGASAVETSTADTEDPVIPTPGPGLPPLFMIEDDNDFTIILAGEVVSKVTELDVAGRAVEGAGGDADACAIADLGLKPAESPPALIEAHSLAANADAATDEVFDLSTQPLIFATSEADASEAERALSDADNLSYFHLSGKMRKFRRSSMPELQMP